MNYQYAINATGQKPILQINKYIGIDKETKEGIDGGAFSKEIFEIDSLHPELITFFVNCMGGKVQQSLDIFNAIFYLKSDNEAIIQGFALSTGGWIPMAAKRVAAYDYSTWMCHSPYNPDDPEQKSEFLDRVFNTVCTLISQRSGRNNKPKKSFEEVRNMMLSETYLTATEMLEHGLIDRIISSDKRAYNFKKEEVEMRYKEYQEISNKFIQENYNNKDTVMAKELIDVVNQLNLTPGTDFAGVMAEVANRANAHNRLEADNKILADKLKAANETQEENQKRMFDIQTQANDAINKVSKLEAELEAAKKELEVVNASKIEMEGKVKDAEEKAKTEADNAKTEKAKSLVAANSFKIDEKDVAYWEKKAFDNYEDAEKTLNLIKVTTQLPRPMQAAAIIENKIEEGSFAHFAAENKKAQDAEEKRREEALKKFM